MISKFALESKHVPRESGYWNPRQQIPLLERVPKTGKLNVHLSMPVFSILINWQGNRSPGKRRTEFPKSEGNFVTGNFISSADRVRKVSSVL